MFEKLKSFCDSFLGLDVPGFDLVIYKDGKCILRYMNGYSDLENKVKMNGNERYNIYSCSKVITCKVYAVFENDLNEVGLLY